MRTKDIYLFFSVTLVVGILAACQTDKATQKKNGFSEPQKNEVTKYDKQIAALKRRIEIDPKDINAYAQLGYLYGLKGDIKEEIKYYKKAVSVYPQYKEVYYNLACAYTDLGQKDKAFRALSLALEHGFRSRSLLESDRDLHGLRDDPRFKELMNKYFSQKKEKSE